MMRVLVVEDSQVARDFLVYILDSDPTINVIGAVKDGVEAVEAAQTKNPHLIVMDINMPNMNGYEATRTIMERKPTPIIIVSSSFEKNETEMSFKAMKASAFTVMQKPFGIGHPDFKHKSKEFIKLVKLMAEVRVVSLRAYLADDREVPLGGQVYLAPDGFHMGVANGGRIFLSSDAPENGMRLSVSYFFCTVAKTLGKNAIGVLLTGMGTDGALELGTMKERGAITIVQDRESSVVFRMPKEATRLGSATYVLPAKQITGALLKLVGAATLSPFYRGRGFG